MMVIPQGSALSAISANIVLSDFDSQLNRNGLTTIRYLDDFLVLGNSAALVERGWTAAIQVLSALNLEAHQPGESSKAARGMVRDGFDFLSFHVTNSSVAPSKAAKAAFLTQIEDVVREAKPAIMSAGNEPRRAQTRFVQTLQQIDRKTRGWGDAFRESSPRLSFAQLDERITAITDSFIGWFLNVQRDKPAKARRRMWGLALLMDTPGPESEQP
jgi:hypothetical protein